MTYTSDNRNPSHAIPGDAPPGRANVDLGDDTAALIAAVPAMLGFRPENSMIFLGLSRSPGGPDNPPGVRATSSEVGPVVRADLVEGAVTAAARALMRANRNRTDCSVIIVVVGGDAGPLVDVAVREFRAGQTPPAAAFLATDLCAGASWWEIPLDGAQDPDGHRNWPIGALPDPAESPAGHVAGQTPGEIPDQAQFDRLLDSIPVPDRLRDVLPDSWRDAEHGNRDVAPEVNAAGRGERGHNTGGTVEADTTALCTLIEHLGDGLADRGETAPGTATPSDLVHDLLMEEGTAAFIARTCTGESLARILIVLSTGPRGREVQLLLTETARLARGPLRHRALVLLSMAAWCGSGGVLAHRAAHRVLAEVESAVAQGQWRTPLTPATQRTVQLARELVETAGQGRPAGIIATMIDDGVRDMDNTLDHAGDGGVRALLGRVVDRDSVSVVRSELARRAVR
ncbi:DUF4192 family protein [uncultured Corynebacterium sp.]|uniref:DUF4192 family protein n=1 Tax=uncultured Corynebacterium sp. TaxID=159447 RepID=UPI0025F9CB9E|nr:DUF4192 family protein [uncultured Corynebacterium sp.]